MLCHIVLIHLCIDGNSYGKKKLVVIFRKMQFSTNTFIKTDVCRIWLRLAIFNNHSLQHIHVNEYQLRMDRSEKK